MRSITISSGSSGGNGYEGGGDLMKIKVARRHIYRVLFHTVLVLALLLPFFFVLTALITLEGRRLGPKLLGRIDDSGRMLKDLVKIMNQMNSEKVPDGLKLPDNFSQLVSDMKNKYSSKVFALVLKGMMERSERQIRESKFAELTNKHFAASAVNKGINCLSLRLTDEYSSTAHARKQLPSPELLPLLSVNFYQHLVVSTDNILAAAVVVASTIQSSLNPEILFSMS